jgi:hypothetical protein
MSRRPFDVRVADRVERGGRVSRVLAQHLSHVPWVMTSVFFFGVGYLSVRNLPVLGSTLRASNQVIATDNLLAAIDEPFAALLEPEPGFERPALPPETASVLEGSIPVADTDLEGGASALAAVDAPWFLRTPPSLSALRLPPLSADALQVRQGSGPRARLERFGGQGTEESVEAGLDWLRRHQTPGRGFWGSADFSKQCRTNLCGGPGWPLHDAGVTGLALLAFVGAGHTHQGGKHQPVVQAGLGWLRGLQDADGCFGPRNGPHSAWVHAICTMAVAEACALTGSPLLRTSLERAVAFIERTQRRAPDGGALLGWQRTGAGDGPGDASVTSWMTMALHAAGTAGVPVGRGAVQGARAFLESVTDPATGRIGGQPPVRAPGRGQAWPPERSESLTALGLYAKVLLDQLLGADSTQDPSIARGARLLRARLPDWDESRGGIDMYYWHSATLAAFQVGGDLWQDWNAALKEAVVRHQRTDGDERGSWDPVDSWGAEGGRVYATALLTLSLEVYYRYEKAHGSR